MGRHVGHPFRVRTPKETATLKYKRAIRRRVSMKGRKSNNNPGFGWTYSVDGDVFRMEAKISGPSRVSFTGLSRTIASTQHLYDLDSIGLPGHFVVANFCRRIPAEQQKVDFKAIAKALAEEEDE